MRTSERLNIVADEICDVVRALAIGPFGAKPNCGLWPNERCALFIRGIKITSNWKERLKQQLLDVDLQDYLMEKEQWTMHSFQNICWKRQETDFKRISKARQHTNGKDVSQPKVHWCPTRTMVRRSKTLLHVWRQ
jgi:hypothetical protein